MPTCLVYFGSIVMTVCNQVLSGHRLLCDTSCMDGSESYRAVHVTVLCLELRSQDTLFMELNDVVPREI